MNNISKQTWIIVAVVIALLLICMCMVSLVLLYPIFQIKNRLPTIEAIPTSVGTSTLTTAPTKSEKVYKIVANICDYTGEKATWRMTTSTPPGTNHVKAENQDCFQEELSISTLGDDTFTIFRCEGECQGWKPLYYERVKILFQDKSTLFFTITYSEDKAGKSSFKASFY